jgi:hypothetical protein
MALRNLLASRIARPVVLAAVFAVGLPSIARATWSILIVDTSTGEVAIGSATCLSGLDLETLTPVMLVGVGGACAQSQIDSSGRNRGYIHDQLLLGTAPADIITGLSHRDRFHQSRQYGIVDLQDRAATFTGNQDGAWAGGVTGSIGTIVYAIQGNVLTGKPVIDDAEAALRNATGDLADRLMAAMDAARDDGGDGRCSCNPSAPNSCGSPPPGFDPDNGDKSAHIGFMMISRIGDTDGGCDATKGCASGTYYMNLNVAFAKVSDDDPVNQLDSKFTDWRNSWIGRPDHIRSTKTLTETSVPGNGTHAVTMMLTMNDRQQTPVGHGGATVTVSHSSKSAGLATIGDPIDHGDGTYEVLLTAGAGQGTDEFQIVVDDGQGPVTLYPFPTLVQTDTLTAGQPSISASAGGTTHFTLSGPEEVPPPPYLLVCSASGTSPGMLMGSVVVPLNLDAVVLASYTLKDSTTFVNTDANLQLDGSSTADFHVEPDELTPLVGTDLAFAYFTHSPVTFASNPVLLSVDP